MHNLIQAIVRAPWALDSWLLVIGAIFGSFLNVVIYRLPRGQSIAHPGSQCPNCGHPIRWWHNLPVVGWMMLRGRCFDCHRAISIRYPLVELAVALMMLGLAGADVWPALDMASSAAGAVGAAGAAGPIDAAGALALATLALHGCLLMALLAATLIALDRQPLPLAIPFVTVVVAVALTVAAPRIHRFDNWPALDGIFPVAHLVDQAPRGEPAAGDAHQISIWSGFRGPGLGAMAGALLGGGYDLLIARQVGDKRKRRNCALLACFGFCLGLKMAIVAGVIAMVVAGLAQLTSRQTDRSWLYPAVLLLAACGWIYLLAPMALRAATN